MVYDHELEKMLALPLEMCLGSVFGHATDYGSGIFEGSSAMMNERTGIPNVILLTARNERLYKRSLPARGYQSPIEAAGLSRTTLDLVAINGDGLFHHPSSRGFVRAYIRTSIHPASLEGYGISLRNEYPIEVGVVAWTWPDYLKPELATEGAVCAITGHQRLFPITGKHASNYGSASVEGSLARRLGADELAYLAPYLIDADGCGYWADPSNVDAKLRDGVISDGPGEECIGIRKKDEALVFAPMRVNRLGGTVLQYIVDHMAPTLGIKTVEADITMHDLRRGKYSALAMVGNAVRVTPVRKLSLYNGENIFEEIDLFEKGEVPETLRLMVDRWDLETRGLVDPSHQSLLTEVDMERGRLMREELDSIS